MQEYGYDTQREWEREREGVVALMKVQLSQLLCHFSDIFYTSFQFIDWKTNGIFWNWQNAKVASTSGDMVGIYIFIYKTLVTVLFPLDSSWIYALIACTS